MREGGGIPVDCAQSNFSSSIWTWKAPCHWHDFLSLYRTSKGPRHRPKSPWNPDQPYQQPYHPSSVPSSKRPSRLSRRGGLPVTRQRERLPPGPREPLASGARLCWRKRLKLWVKQIFIPGVQKTERNAQFLLLWYIKKYSIFWFHQIKHCLLKRMIPRSFDLVQ